VGQRRGVDDQDAKLRTKVSGCLRTLSGAQEFAAIRSYTATAVRQGQNMLQVLVQAADANPWIPPLELNPTGSDADRSRSCAGTRSRLGPGDAAVDAEAGFPEVRLADRVGPDGRDRQRAAHFGRPPDPVFDQA
jgi:hypothetical protein